MTEQTTLDGYTRGELHKIVDLYNLGLDLKTLQKSKESLLKTMKEMMKKKKKLVLPSKEELKKHKLKKRVPKKEPGQKNIKNYFKS